jgi:predicted dehydrogenase
MVMINISVIGCGHWGPNHIRNFNTLPNSKVVAAVDVDEGRLARVREMFPGIHMEKDYRKVLEDPNVDAVVIATPTHTHYSIVREALMAGKHVLCEKPLCEKSSEGQELSEIADARKLALMVGHVFLFNPGIVRLKEFLHSGEIGTLNYVSAVRTNLGPIRTDVNAAFDLASHDISIFNWLLESEPELVSAVGGSFLQNNIEDVVFLSLRYPDGVLANIQASWLNPKKVRQISVIGTRRMITWDDLDMNSPIAIYDKGADLRQEYGDFGEFLRISMWDGDVRLPKVNQVEPLKAQDGYFLDVLQNGAMVQRSNGEFSVGVVRALEAAVESLKSGGNPVRVGS